MQHITIFELTAYVLLALVIAAIIHRFHRIFLRGIPDLSAEAVGILRVVFGFVLLGLLDRLALPDAVGGPGSPREAVLWEPWGWVEYLTTHWNVRDALHAATYVTVGAFIVGAFTRIAYAAVCAGFVVRLLVAQEFGSGSHAWVIFPFVLLPLVIVPWGDALSVDAWIRRRRGRPSRAQAPGPRYGVAVWLPGLTLGCAWLAAAGAKLRIGGVEWVSGGAVRYHWAEDVLNSKVGWGSWIAGHDWAAVLFSGAGVAAEALFITHAFFRSEWVRLAYGLVGASLLGGFYLFQGVYWHAWWVILLFFLPWQATTDLLMRAVPRLRTPARTGGRSLRPGLAVAAIAAFLLVQQLVMSWERVEQMPFFSNYPMYSETSASPEAFNARVAPIKYYRYRVVIADGPRRGKELASVLGINEVEAVRNAVVWRLNQGDAPLEGGEREALIRARERYRALTGDDLRLVRVDTEPRIFDFVGGGITAEGAPAVPPMEVDVANLEVRPI